MEKEAAVSELVSALLLTAVLVAGASVILTGITSQYPPARIPGTGFDVWNESGNILVRSTGGDPLNEGNYSIRVYDNTRSEIWLYNSTGITNAIGNNNLIPGNTLNLPSVIGSNPGTRVQVLYRHKGDRDTGTFEFEEVMYEKRLG